MKKLLIFSTLIAGSLIATTASAQVYVNARIGFGIPARRVYVAPPPTVVYQQPAPAVVYQQPAPACQDGYGQDGYNQDGYAPAPTTVVYENEFPGYAYYNYPAWNGHYRDRYYYAHYRPYFERQNSGYFNRGRFDRNRFERERYARGPAGRGNYDRRGEHRGW